MADISMSSRAASTWLTLDIVIGMVDCEKAQIQNLVRHKSLIEFVTKIKFSLASLSNTHIEFKVQSCNTHGDYISFLKKKTSNILYYPLGFCNNSSNQHLKHTCQE